MTIQDILPLLTGPAAALAVLIWVVWMQRQDIKDLRRINHELVRRADSAEEAARTSNALISGLIKHAVVQRESFGGDRE